MPVRKKTPEILLLCFSLSPPHLPLCKINNVSALLCLTGMLMSKFYVHEILIFSEKRTESQEEILSSSDLPHRPNHTMVEKFLSYSNYCCQS